MFSALGGPADAGVFSVTPVQSSVYDLIRDGKTSSDGGDSTVKDQDQTTTAITALKLVASRWQNGSFVGQVDEIGNAANVILHVPLGAAKGTKSEQEPASPIVLGQSDAVNIAQTVGQTRLSSLIGSVGYGSVVNDRVGATVFVAAVSTNLFAPGRNLTNAPPGTAVASAPSSTSTTTITVAGVGGFSRAEGRGGSVTLTANGLQGPTIALGTSVHVTSPNRTQPSIGYNYTLPPNEGAKVTALASFSDVVTANGVASSLHDTDGPNKARIGILQMGMGQPLGLTIGQRSTAEVSMGYVKQTDTLLPTQPRDFDVRSGGTSTFMSASVGVDPRAITGGVMAHVIQSARTGPAKQSVETFRVGSPSTSGSRDALTATISDPLRGKIMASSGALNTSLALP